MAKQVPRVWKPQQDPVTRYLPDPAARPDNPPESCLLEIEKRSCELQFSRAAVTNPAGRQEI